MTSTPTASLQRFHVVMRIGAYNERNIGDNVIDSHNQIARKEGTVYLGKAGRGLSASNTVLVSKAIENGADCRLILVTRKGKQISGFSAALKSLPATLRQADESRVPQYYRDLIPEIRSWFAISELKPIASGELSDLVLVSNGRPLLETIEICRTSLMVVRESKR